MLYLGCQQLTLLLQFYKWSYKSEDGSKSRKCRATGPDAINAVADSVSQLASVIEGSEKATVAMLSGKRDPSPLRWTRAFR